MSRRSGDRGTTLAELLVSMAILGLLVLSLASIEPMVMRRGAEVELGGKIFTESFEGFVVEAAADSFLARKPWARALVEELGIAEELHE